jgi:hypothetical protein
LREGIGLDGATTTAAAAGSGVSGPGHRLHLLELFGPQIDGSTVDGIINEHMHVDMAAVAVEHGDEGGTGSESFDPLPDHFFSRTR